MDGLSDVMAPTPALNDMIAWNGANWVNSPMTNTSATSGLIFYKATPIITATGTGNIINIATLSRTPVVTTEQTSTGTTTA